MNRIFYLLLFLAGFSIDAKAQGFIFGLKGGPTIGFQNWDGSERDPLFKYHGILFLESLEDEGKNFALFGQVGYHIKGSAVRYNFRPQCLDGNGNYVDCTRQTLEYQFKNISVTLGGKKKFDSNSGNKLYYAFGLRGEYTVKTNLSQFNNGTYQYFGGYPIDGFVNKFNYGMTLSGGIEFKLSDLIGAIIELSVNPDFSLQYKQPAIPNLTNPVTGQQYTSGERTIRNVAFEISAGFRFTRKIIYIDD